MVSPWAANTSPHTQFQKGLELSRQALIPPEWPLLPAKERHQHTPPMWGQPALCLGWRHLWTEGRWEGLGARQKSGISVLGGPRRGTGCFVSAFLELPSFA